MRFFSIAAREMRVMSRRAAMYHARWLTGAVFLLLLLWLAWVMDFASNRRANKDIFEVFSICIYFYCLLVGAAGSADCLSREKREGTLGLLFLSNLNSREIVAGKICSSSLSLFYSLLGVFPLLALPVVFGGITTAVFWCTVLALLNALWFAMTCGFIASAVCEKQFPAVALATGLAMFLGAGWAGLMQILKALGWPADVTYSLANFCPLTTLLHVARGRMFIGGNDFFHSLGLVFASSIIALLLVSVWIARTWRDRPKRARRHFWQSRSAAPAPVVSRANVELRRRLLGINPFYWLAGRRRVSSPAFLGVGALLVLSAMGAARTADTHQLEIFCVASVLLCLALHVITLY